jgi:general stress protein CsbA
MKNSTKSNNLFPSIKSVLFSNKNRYIIIALILAIIVSAYTLITNKNASAATISISSATSAGGTITITLAASTYSIAGASSGNGTSYAYSDVISFSGSNYSINRFKTRLVYDII